MTDPRIVRTREALADALLDLLAEKAFADLSITEIAERAGIGYATFFRHYAGKEALLADVTDRLVDALLARMLPALREADTRAASLALCRFVEERRSITHALLGGGAEAIVHAQAISRARARADTIGLPRPGDLPADLVIVHGVGATLSLLAWWLDQAKVDAERMAIIIDRLVMVPLRKEGN